VLLIIVICQIALSALTPDAIPSTVSDGPYIFYQEDGQLESVSLVEGTVKSTIISLGEGVAEVSTSIPSVPTILISQEKNSIPKDKHQMPSKLLALSDLEGNLEHLLQFLQSNNVIDGEYNWSWGNGHVLFNGDSVDRGDQVTELLWFIRKLQQQANNAGGQVHFVLGNHDVMIMANDLRYTHPKYKLTVQKTGIPYHQLFGETSILGNWLRSQNSIVQVGPYLFVHAGYSPELDVLKLSLSDINSKIRKNLGPPAWPNKDDLSTSLAWHKKGPLWYRGYFDKHSTKYGPKPSNEQLQSILTRHNAKAIIVGHTVTGNVGYLDGNKKLIGIDVHWDTLGEGQGLLIEGENISRVTISGQIESLATIHTGN